MSQESCTTTRSKNCIENVTGELYNHKVQELYRECHRRVVSPVRGSRELCRVETSNLYVKFLHGSHLTTSRRHPHACPRRALDSATVQVSLTDWSPNTTRWTNRPSAHLKMTMPCLESLNSTENAFASAQLPTSEVSSCSEKARLTLSVCLRYVFPPSKQSATAAECNTTHAHAPLLLRTFKISKIFTS
jgi:hypothetical protein